MLVPPQGLYDKLEQLCSFYLSDLLYNDFWYFETDNFYIVFVFIVHYNLTEGKDIDLHCFVLADKKSSRQN